MFPLYQLERNADTRSRVHRITNTEYDSNAAVSSGFGNIQFKCYNSPLKYKTTAANTSRSMHSARFFFIIFIICESTGLGNGQLV